MKAIVIDGMNLCHRNHHTLGRFQTKAGMKTGLIYGTLQSFLALKRRYPDHHVYFLWDTKSTHRYDIYPEYKERRKAKRDTDDYKELSARVEDLKTILVNHDCSQLTAEGYEADDIAKWITDKAVPGDDVLLVSNDRDWMQLIDDTRGVRILRPGAKGQERIYNEEEFKKEFNFPVQGYQLFKCLKGDKSDNVKGIMRFPEKLATALANRVYNIEQFYMDKTTLTDVDEKWASAIRYNKDELRLNAKLVTLYGDIDNIQEIVGKTDNIALEKFYRQFEFEVLLSQIRKKTFFKERGKQVVKTKRFRVKRTVSEQTKPEENYEKS